MIDQLLRDARPEVTAPDPTATLRARRALLRKALARRSRRRNAVRAVIAVGAAAAIAAATLVVQTPNHGASAAAAAAILDRSADALDSAPSPLPGQYVYRTTTDLAWDYGPSPTDPTKEDTRPRSSPNIIETWVPTDPEKPLIQRSEDSVSGVTWALVDQDDNPAWEIYQHPPEGPAAMLEALRDLARRTGSQDPNDDEVIWGNAFSLMWDPQTPDQVKADILRALTLLDGVSVVDQHVTVGGRVGVALGYDEQYSVDFVFDPDDDTLIGFRGHPERGPDWVGPHEPVFTTSFVSRIVDSAPRPPERLLNDFKHTDGPPA